MQVSSHKAVTALCKAKEEGTSLLATVIYVSVNVCRLLTGKIGLRPSLFYNETCYGGTNTPCSSSRYIAGLE